ncbi:MAG: glycosyltransferase family 39 protein [Bacteroidales bacterium]|nr:glycosyltransferase family 39 protein [Bacteroidales bacterium]
MTKNTIRRGSGIMNTLQESFNNHPLAFVFFFVTLCLLPVLIMKDWSPSNELRYIGIADEALRDGHVFAFYTHGVAYADKPPLYLWLIMLSKTIFGKHVPFILNMFSFIPALVIVWVMDRWIRLERASDRAVLALMCLTMLMYIGMAVVLRMDMLMCMFIVLALFTFYKMYTGVGNPRSQRIMLPVWIFLALFTKGPVGILVPPISILVFLAVKGKIRETGKYLGWRTWAIIAVLFGLWILGAYLEGGKEYINNLLFHQTVDRAVNAFHHKKPLWYYIPALFYTTAPYCILLVGSVVAVLAQKWAKRKDPDAEPHQMDDAETLFLCTIISTFVMLSAFSSKLSIYLAPIFPFMVWLFPMALEKTGWKKWMGWSLGIPAGLLVLAGIAAVFVKIFMGSNPKITELLSQYSIAYSPLIWAAIVLITVGNIAALVSLFKKMPWNFAVFMMASSLLLAIYTGSSLMPRLNDYIGYKNLCSEIPEGKRVVTLNVHRPDNMDVYLGRGVTDYGKDYEAFLNEEFPSDGSERDPFILVVKGKTLKTRDDLRFLEKYSAAYVGEYCILSLPGYQAEEDGEEPAL